MRLILCESLKGVLEARESFLKRSIFHLTYVSSLTELYESLRHPDAALAVVGDGIEGIEHGPSRQGLADRFTHSGLTFLLLDNGRLSQLKQDPLVRACAGIVPLGLSATELIGLMERHIGTVQRREIRVRVGMDVKCEYPFHLFSGELRNLSVGGALLETDVRLHLGSTIRLDFSIPAIDYFVSTQGRIIWSMADRARGFNRYGIEFCGMKGEDKKMIGLFVKRKALEEQA